MKKKLMKFSTIIMLVCSMSLNIFLYINVNGKNSKTIHIAEVDKSAIEDNCDKLIKKSVMQDRFYLLENKKKFLIDILDNIPIVVNNNINNSIKNVSLEIATLEKREHKNLIKTVLREVNYYNLTGKLRNNDIYKYISKNTQHILFNNYSKNSFKYYYKVEPVNPKDVITEKNEGYVYYLYFFNDSIEPYSSDPYGDINKFLIYIKKDSNRWIIDEITSNN